MNLVKLVEIHSFSSWHWRLKVEVNWNKVKFKLCNVMHIGNCIYVSWVILSFKTNDCILYIQIQEFGLVIVEERNFRE